MKRLSVLLACGPVAASRRGGRRAATLLAVAACSLAVLGAGAGAAQAAACTATWTGAAHDGEWGNAGNWSGGVVPGASAGLDCDVVLPSTGSAYSVDLSLWTFTSYNGLNTVSDGQIGSLTIGSGARLVIHGQAYQQNSNIGQQIALTLATGGTIAAGGSLELLATDDGSAGPSGPSGGEGTLNGSGTITNYGSFSSVSTSTQASPTNAAWDNQLGVSLVNEPGATAAVTSGFLDVNAENVVTNQGTWTVASGAQMALEYNGFNQHGTATSFVNDGSYINSGTTIMAQHDHAQVGDEFSDPIVWNQQGGSVSGDPVQFIDGAELEDAAGAGSFLFKQQEGQIAGTIPAGQTVTVQGALYGSDAYQNDVTLDGSAVTNQGTLIIDSPNVSTDVSAGVQLNGSPLVNQGTLEFTDESPTLINQINTTVTNQAGGTIDLDGGTTWFDAGQTDTNAGTIAIVPGADLDIEANPFLSGATTFINTGTIAPQISATGSGHMTFGGDAKVTLGGTVSPQLLGGYTPAAGSEIQAFPINPSGVTLTGSFVAVNGGFSADYHHETGNAPNYVGLIYHQAVTTAATATIAKPRVKGDKVSLTLSCHASGPCQRASIAARVSEKAKRKHGKAKAKTVLVASTSATLKAGASKTVVLTLNRAGTRLLAKAHHLKVRLAVTVGGKVDKTFTVILSRRSKSKARRRLR